MLLNINKTPTEFGALTDGEKIFYTSAWNEQARLTNEAMENK
jgi:hypothetical protein